MTGARIGVPPAALYAGIAALVALLVAVGSMAGRASTAVPVVPAAPSTLEARARSVDALGASLRARYDLQATP